MPSNFMRPFLRTLLGSTSGGDGGGGADPDVTAPTLTLATGVATGATTATIGVTTNDGSASAGYIYGEARTSSTPADADELIDGTGTYSARAFTNLANSGAGIKTFDLTGLSESVPLYAHWVQQDAFGNKSNVEVSAVFTPAAEIPIANQNIEFGGLTAANAGGAFARASNGDPVSFVSVDAVVSGVGTGWSVSAGTLVRSSTPATSHNAVLTCTTSLGVIDVTIKCSGDDANGFDLAVGRSVNDMTQLKAAIENTSLAFGDNIFLRTGSGLYNPTHSLALRPNMAGIPDGGPWVAPSLYDEDHPDKGYDLDTANWVTMTKHAGADPIIAHLSLNGLTNDNWYFRIHNLKFNYQPLAFIPSPGNTYTLTGLTCNLNGVNMVAIDNCEIWSTADGLPAEQGQVYSGIALGVGTFYIQDNHIHDVAYALALTGTTAKVVGNHIERFWGGAIQVNFVADVLIAWNTITNVRNFDTAYMNVHPDFLQYDDGAAGSQPRTGVRIICNRWDIGDYPFNESGAQGLFGGPSNGIGTNPFFTSDTGWTKDAGWTISGGDAVATAVADGNGISQSVTLIEGQTYQAQINIQARTAGGIKVVLTGGTEVESATLSTVSSSHNVELVAGAGNTGWELRAVGSTTLTVETAQLFMPIEGMVVAGNIIVAQAFHIHSMSRIKDSFYYNNTLLMDTTEAVDGWFRMDYGRDNTIKYNIVEQFFDLNAFSASTITNNTEVLLVDYEDAIEDPVPGADITELKDQYDVLVGSAADLANHGANSRFIDWDNREHNFPDVLEAELALQNSPGLRAIPIGNVTRGGVGWASLGGATLDATGESCQMIGRIITNDGAVHTLDNTGSIEWRAGAVTFAAAGPSSTFKVGIGDVDPTLGVPGRVTHASDIIAFDVEASYVSGTLAPTTSAWNVTAMTTGSRIIQDGDEIAICFQMVSRAGADSVIVNAVNNSIATQYPFVTTFLGGVYANAALVPNAIIRFGDGAEGYFVGGQVASAATATTSFNNTSGTKEYGNVFEFDYPVRITGFVGVFVPSADFEIVLYSDHLGTPVAERTAAFDSNSFAAAVAGQISGSFDSYYDLPANTPIVIALKPTSASNVAISSVTLNAAGDAEAYPGAGIGVSRAAAAFSVVNASKDHFPLGLLQGGFDDGA